MIDWRDGYIRVLGHPLHPILTDFPIALWSLALFWDVLALWRGDGWWQASFWTLVLGLVAALGAALTGLLDSRRIGSEEPAQRTLNLHMLLMGGAVTVVIGNVLVRGGDGDLSSLRAAAAVGCSLAANAAVIAGAWFGGELVFGHAVGVSEGAAPASTRPVDLADSENSGRRSA
jgi:uncharacterized membrane protein